MFSQGSELVYKTNQFVALRPDAEGDTVKFWIGKISKAHESGAGATRSLTVQSLGENFVTVGERLADERTSYGGRKYTTGGQLADKFHLSATSPPYVHFILRHFRN